MRSVENAPFHPIDIAVAGALLTRAPWPVDPELAGLRAGRAAWAYPVIGALLGLGAGLVYWLLAALGVAQGPAAALTLAALVVAAGALHEDGLADAMDGIGGGRDRAHALEIMKDSRLGAFGGCALALSFLARWSAIAALSPAAAILALVAAGALSRAAMAAVMAGLPPARPDGLSQGAGRPDAAAALAAGAIGLVAALLCGWAGLAAALAAALGAGWIAWLARRKLGGQTGDVLGAAQQLAEIGALAALSA